MADKKHTVNFDITATDRASLAFKSVKSSVDGLASSYTALAGAATAAFAVGGIASFLSDAVRYRAALDDFSDTTGDNVRTLDALARQARVSGLEFDRLEGSLSKFARNLNNTDEEGQAAGAALAALGLNVRQLQAMKPADAMLEVAKALGKFDDGAGKVAVSVALMGKEGAKMLPFLKDLAEAGEVNGRITADQAAQADQLEKSWRSLKMAFEDSKQEIATGMIPRMAELVEQMREGIRIAGGFGAAIRILGQIDPGKSVGENIGKTQGELDAWQNGGSFYRFMNKPFGATYAGTGDELQKRLDFLKYMQRQEAMRLAGPGSLDARDLQAAQKGALNYTPPAAGGKENTDKSAADYAHSLELQNQMLDEANKLGAEFLLNEQKKIDLLQAEADAYLKLLDPGRQYIEDQTKINKLVEAGKLTQEQGVRVQRQLLEGRTKVDDLTKSADLAAAAGHSIGLSFSSAMDRLTFDSQKGINALDLLRATALDVAKALYGKAVVDPAARGIEGFIANFGKTGSTSSTAFSNPDFIPEWAAGGAFERGRVVPFANGDVINRPTLFPMASGAGLMGEAGPEAIMPLRRTSRGRLGVEVSGGGGGVVIHQQNSFAVGVRGEVRAELAMQMPAIARAAVAAMLQAQRNGVRN